MSDIASQEFFENPSLTSLGQIFQEKAPGWKLVNAMYPDESKAYPEWSDDDNKAVIQIASLASPEEASSHLQMFAWHIPLTPYRLTEMQRDPAHFKLPQPIMPDAKLPDVGDENHVWSKYDESGRSLIKFRSGNLLVQVDGSSLAVAERLARLIAEQMHAA